jgi:membrane peptidoglycan carboxypeptidase
MQMVRQFSGKMVALNHAAYEPPPPPLALYHSQSLPDETQPKSARWRRSRALRMSMRVRHRRTRSDGMPQGRRILVSLLIAVMALLVITLSSSGAYAYSFYQSELPQVNNIANQHISQITRIYDRNGVLLGDAYDPNSSGQRTYVDISYIPKVMQDAMVATENRTFWTDSGIDPQGITRAAIGYVASGFKVQSGGSTLTQQLVKDMTGDDQVTANRKISEAFLAVGLTQQYPKSKILEMYLNVAPFGTTRLGVESAAQQYFGLSRQCTQDYAKGIFKCTPAIAQLDYDPVKKTHSAVLALARATFLSSMPQDPAHYDPYVWSSYSDVNYKQFVLARQQGVLATMMDMGTRVKGLGPNGQDGLITPAIAKQVYTITNDMKFQSSSVSMKDPHFFYWVVSQLEISLGNGDSALGSTMLQNGGYNVRTTIDSNLEAYVERVIDHQLNDLTYQRFLPTSPTILSKYYNVGDAAAVVMNAKTGEILAMAGSQSYNNPTNDPRIAGNNNVVTGNNGASIGRQPGSTFKPIVYATAFEMGMYPGMVLPDVRTYFPNGQNQGTSTTAPVDQTGIWIPNDYGDKPNNLVLPLRDDLADSYNIPAGKVMAFAGIENVYNTAARMGVTRFQNAGAACIQADNFRQKCGMGTSVTLGSIEVPLIQMAQAYQVFANQGARVAPQGVLDVWDNYGNHLYHYDPNHVQKSQVISPQIAYMITAMMADEPARYREFLTDHDLSFYDWDTTCTAKVYAPYPDCAQHQVAAKTGTTDNFIDNLTVGYTPDVVVGVWAGNANGEAMANNVVGITGAAPIWHSIIERVSGKPCDDTGHDVGGTVCGPLDVNSLGLSNQGTFTNPGGLVEKCVSSADGLMASSSSDCDLMIPGQEPLQAGITSTVTNPDKNAPGKGGPGNGGPNGTPGNGGPADVTPTPTDNGPGNGGPNGGPGNGGPGNGGPGNGGPGNGG